MTIYRWRRFIFRSALTAVCAVVLASCGGESAPEPLPDVAGATLTGLSVIDEVGLPSGSDFSISSYLLVSGSTLTVIEQGSEGGPVETEVPVTAEQVTELSELIQASGLETHEAAEASPEISDGDCRERGRVFVSASWDNGVEVLGSMPEAMFTNIDSCPDGGWNLTGDTTDLLAELRELANN